jgi:hypothetical protein
MCVCVFVCVSVSVSVGACVCAFMWLCDGCVYVCLVWTYNECILTCACVCVCTCTVVTIWYSKGKGLFPIICTSFLHSMDSSLMQLPILLTELFLHVGWIPPSQFGKLFWASVCVCACQFIWIHVQSVRRTMYKYLWMWTGQTVNRPNLNCWCLHDIATTAEKRSRPA